MIFVFYFEDKIIKIFFEDIPIREFVFTALLLNNYFQKTSHPSANIS